MSHEVLLYYLIFITTVHSVDIISSVLQMRTFRQKELRTLPRSLVSAEQRLKRRVFLTSELRKLLLFINEVYVLVVFFATF